MKANVVRSVFGPSSKFIINARIFLFSWLICSRYIWETYKRGEISREVYDFCINNKIADRNLIAMWKKVFFFKTVRWHRRDTKSSVVLPVHRIVSITSVPRVSVVYSLSLAIIHRFPRQIFPKASWFNVVTAVVVVVQVEMVVSE